MKKRKPGRPKEFENGTAIVSFSIDRILWEAFKKSEAGKGRKQSRGIARAIRFYLERADEARPKVLAPIPSGKVGSLTVPVPKDIASTLAAFAARKGKPVSVFTREAIALYVRDHLGEEPEFEKVEEWRWIEQE